MSAWRPPALGELSGVCFSAVQAKTYEDATTALLTFLVSKATLTFMEVTRFKDVSRAESYCKILCYTHFESGLTVEPFACGALPASSLILTSASKIMGPQAFKSMVYSCKNGFAC